MRFPIHSTALLLLAALTAMGLAACGGPAPSKPASDSGAPAVPSTPATAPVEITIGDAEQEIWLSLQLDPSSKTQAMQEELMSDPRGRVNLATVTVSGEAPQPFRLAFLMVAKRQFPETPIAIRGEIRAEVTSPDSGETQRIPVATFSKVFGAAAQGDMLSQQVDIGPILAQLPNSFLLLAEADAVILPKGTDETSVDPATASSTPNMTTKLYSNPVRVTLNPAGA